MVVNEATLNILVGGPTEQWPDALRLGQVRGRWIGVDRGALRLLELGIIPDIAVGDFDSTRPAEFQQVKQRVKQIITFPPEKDFTDTQIGVITAIDHFTFDRLNIYGATGGRLDHLLSNLFLVLGPRFRPYLSKIHFIDRQNTVSYFEAGTYAIHPEADKKYLAFVNLTETNNLTLLDEKYPLDHYSSCYPITWASNEFTGPVNHFKFDSGIVAVIQSRDEP